MKVVKVSKKSTEPSKQIVAVYASISDSVHKSTMKYEREKDFFAIIQHDLSYLEALQGLLKAQHDILLTSAKQMDPFYLGTVNVMHHETLAKEAIQRSLIADKYKHYNEIFLPTFKKKLEIAKKRWTTVMGNASKAVDNEKFMGTDTHTKLKMLCEEALSEISENAKDKELQDIIRAEYLPKINRLLHLLDIESKPTDHFNIKELHNNK